VPGWGAPAEGVPAGEALSGDLFRESFSEVVDVLGVPWLGDADCCVLEMPRDAWEVELESFFFEDLLSFARDSWSCYKKNKAINISLIQDEQGITTCKVEWDGVRK